MLKKKMLSEGNQIHNFISSSGFLILTSYGSGSGSTRQKVTVPTVPVPGRFHNTAKPCTFHTISFILGTWYWGKGVKVPTLPSVYFNCSATSAAAFAARR
jgi:hypothetical protein